ncbi:SDR family oxidoreductase [Streptomyces milbemycinicus]
MTDSRTPAGVAVVTGASSGIGAATARELAAAGFTVALLARRLDRIAAVAEEIGNGAIAIEADVTDRASLVAAADRVRTELGGATVLVNNAGVALVGPFGSERRDDCRRMIEVNLLGTITATEVFLDQLKAAAHADIVNISSVAGRRAEPGGGVHAATKWGVNGWSESLRLELKPKIRVTLIEPGSVATELPQHITHPETREAAVDAWKQVEVTAADVAEVVVFAVTRHTCGSRCTRSWCGRPGRSSERGSPEGEPSYERLRAVSLDKGVDSRSAQRTAEVVPHSPPRIRPTEPACHPLEHRLQLPSPAADLSHALHAWSTTITSSGSAPLPEY